MSTVGLTEYVKNQILNKLEQTVSASQGKRLYLPESVPEGVADEVFSLTIPPDNEKKILELVPDAAFEMGTSINLLISFMNDSTTPYTTPYKRNMQQYVYAPYKEKHLHVPGDIHIRNASGIEDLYWRSGIVNILVANDGSTIKLPGLRDYVEAVREVYENNQKNSEEICKAREELNAFLSQHRTLQKAIKSFGPGGDYLLEFVPDHIKIMLNREPKQRAKREKPAPVTIDKDYLVGIAAASKLNLN